MSEDGGFLSMGSEMGSIFRVGAQWEEWLASQR